MRGAMGRVCSQFIPAVENGKVRQVMDRQFGVPARQRQCDLRRVDASAGGQQFVALAEIETCPADMARTWLSLAIEAQHIAIACGIFLQQHGIGPGGHQCAGGYADRLTWAHRSRERVPGSAFANHAPRPILAKAQGIAVHGGEIGRRLGAMGEQRFGKTAAQSLFHRHMFRRERSDGSEQTGLRLCKRNGGLHRIILPARASRRICPRSWPAGARLRSPCPCRWPWPYRKLSGERWK
mgnify:CR=1 FL=1